MDIEIYYARFYSYEDNGLDVGLSFGEHGFKNSQQLKKNPEVFQHYTADEKVIGVKIDNGRNITSSYIYDVLENLTQYFDELNDNDETDEIEKIIESGAFDLYADSYKFIDVLK